MIVAGIGCKNGIDKDAILLAVRTAFEHASLDTRMLGALATGIGKASEPALRLAAEDLGVLFVIVSENALREAAPRLLTRSTLSLEHTGSPCLSEAAALAAAGEKASLTGPRLAHGGVTCAIAIIGETR